MIEKLKQLLTMHEGEVNHAYEDSECYLTVGNTGLTRSGPAGIMIPSFKWKNT